MGIHLSIEEGKEGDKREWENRKEEGKFHKWELVSNKPHCCKIVIF
jgi:hypothetical protein